MNYTHILLFYILILLPKVLAKKSLIETLDKAHRAKQCCLKKMRCCKNNPELSKMHLQAVLMRCPNEVNPPAKRTFKTKVELTREDELENFQGFESNEITDKTQLTHCKRKLVITMKFSAITSNRPQFIVVDHVFDPVSNTHQRLLNPYVIKLQENLIRQTYPLKFSSYVNSEAREIVHNKNEANYTGCRTKGSNPTCGLVYLNNKIMQYSEGFCCSCDTAKNIENQPFGTQYSEAEAFDDPTHLIENTQCKENAKECGNSTNTTHSELGNDQMLSGGVQIRGGQNCADRYTPPNVDPISYHESTHCLKFSEVWYGLYKMQFPRIEHSITIQLFEKKLTGNDRCLWRDLTERQQITLNLSDRVLIGNADKQTVGLYYHLNSNEPSFILNHEKQRILIPECSSDECAHPEMIGGPQEFLVLPHDKINLDGDQCNVPGVGFEAFYRQPNRCGVKRGSCLANQPRSLWKHDKQAEKLKCKGYFFLKNYGIVPDNALFRNESDPSDVKLELLHNGSIYSTLDIEINADSNIVLRPNSAAAITEVYVDSTMATKTILTVKVTNTGLVSSKFFVKLSDCPEEIPEMVTKTQSEITLIPPQNQHVFTLTIVCKLPANVFYCSAEVLNCNNELVALRRVKIQRSDRCFCMFYCLCACVGSTAGLKCRPMSLEHYHAAGFQGTLPVPIYLTPNSHLADLLFLLFSIFLFIILTLLLLGLAKAVIGVCCATPVGIWGLDIILDLPKRMKKYYESSLRDYDVIYDENNWPIHPVTNEKVRNISIPTEFCTNIVFFFLFPIMIIARLFRKIFSKPTCTCLDMAELCVNPNCPTHYSKCKTEGNFEEDGYENEAYEYENEMEEMVEEEQERGDSYEANSIAMFANMESIRYSPKYCGGDNPCSGQCSCEDTDRSEVNTEEDEEDRPCACGKNVLENTVVEVESDTDGKGEDEEENQNVYEEETESTVLQP